MTNVVIGATDYHVEVARILVEHGFTIVVGVGVTATIGINNKIVVSD